MKYYKTLAYVGHRGNGNRGELMFYFKAKDALDAMMRAKRMPSVKHSFTPTVVEVEKAEYDEHIKVSAYINVPEKERKRIYVKNQTRRSR